MTTSASETSKQVLLTVATIWLASLVLVALSASYVSISKFLVDILVHQGHVQLALLAPGVCLFALTVGLQGIRTFMNGTEFGNGAAALTLLVVYCYYLVLVTGGIAASAFNSLIAVVVLLGGLSLGILRTQLLVAGAILAIFVFLLSRMNAFTVPIQYPDEWSMHGKGDEFVTLAIIVLSFLLEWCIARVKG